MQFPDPCPQSATVTSTPFSDALPDPAKPEPGGVDILAVPCLPADHPDLREEVNNWVARSAPGEMALSLGIVTHGVQVFWRPGVAAILAAPDRMDAILNAVVEFCYYENELRKLEQEVGAAWHDLEADTPLAHDVTPHALERREQIAQRTEVALQRRMRHARIQPHLNRPSALLTLQAQELGQRLREKSKVEERHESLDGQLGAFERIYEMASQRISDFRSSREERKLEWFIIVLLAAEVLLLLAELLYHLDPVK
jgi:hypothetical protein